MNKQTQILEALHESRSNTAPVNEAKLPLDDNIDEKKFCQIESECQKAGYLITGFSAYKFDASGPIHSVMMFDRMYKDKLVPMLDRDDDGKVYVHPAYMGNLTPEETVKYADYLKKAATLAKKLSKIKIKDLMTKDHPGD